MKPKAVVTLSGGLDSAVALAVGRGFLDIQRAYFVEYGQKTLWQERRCAYALAEWYGLGIESLVIAPLDSPLTNQPLPEGALSQSASADPNTVTPLYVPMRNLILLAHIASAAYNLGIHQIVTGNTPSVSYPDTGKEYLLQVEKTLDVSSWKIWKIYAPLIEMTKAQVVSLGIALNVPLWKTWSCYLSQTQEPCGQCRGCLKRAEAFREMVIQDPALKGGTGNGN